MQAYILRRLVFGAFTALLVSVIIFSIMRIAPGDVALMIVSSEGDTGSAEATEARVKLIREELGLNHSLPVQYLTWVGNWVTGDWGKSLYNSRSVWEEFKRKVPISLELSLISLAISTSVAIPAGIIMALKQDKWPDYVVRVATLFMLSMPNFWVATLVLMAGVYWFDWSPRLQYVSIFENPASNLAMLIWPAAIMGMHNIAGKARMTRSSMLEVLRQDYIRTAHAKGLRGFVVTYKHALKNAMLPVITMIGLSLAVIMAGTVIMERIFSLPGMGNMLIEGMNYRDYPVVQSLVLMFSIWIVLANIIVDITYGLLDPRIRYD